MKKLTQSLAGLAFVLTQTLAIAGCGSADEASNSPLKLDVFAADEASFHVTSTLIEGEQDAILVDAQLTRSQARLLADRIAESGKRLTAIYITHAHQDHSFGAEILKQRFPGVRVLARQVVADEMKATGAEEIERLKPVFKDDLTDVPVDAEPYSDDTLDLEGHEIRILGPLQGDAADTFPVYVPELGALIVGDDAFNGLHVFAGDTSAAQRDTWVASLEELEALKPAIVVAGHKDPARDDGPEVLEQTRVYLEDLDSAVDGSSTAEEAEQKMLAKYGDLKLPVILDMTIQAIFPAAGP